MIRIFEKLLVVLLSSVVLVSCDVSEIKQMLKEGEERTAEDVDDTVEGIWLDLNEGKLVPLGEWLKSDPENTLEWISNKDAVELERAVKEKYGVQLCAISESDLPNYTVAIVVKMPKGVDREGLKQALLAVPSEYKADLEMGNRWIILDGLVGEGGEYIRK